MVVTQVSGETLSCADMQTPSSHIDTRNYKRWLPSLACRDELGLQTSRRCYPTHTKYECGGSSYISQSV